MARVLETTPHDELDPVTKIKVLREEQDSIKAERVQRKQELIEKQKSEKGKTIITGLPEGDQAPLLKGLKNEGKIPYSSKTYWLGKTFLI